jgi:hypothetical protein
VVVPVAVVAGGGVVVRKEAELERGDHPSIKLMVLGEGVPVLALALPLRQGPSV